MYGEVDTAQLYEIAVTTTDLGEEVESRTLKESFPARLHQLRADRRYESNRYTGVVEWRLYADISKINADIERAKHEIDYDGDTYIVESVNDIDKLCKRYQIDMLRTD